MPEERKLVTILFADVTGSTALGDELDPEDVRAFMGRYYAHARDVIASYGGTLEKFIGDAVMAVFGLPRAHGDDAERALAAALALQQAVANDEMLGPSFQLRIGVNTGEVVATSDPSSGDFLVTGDTVNVAARLQQHTNPGEIVASERTMHAAEKAFHFAVARLVEVKGKREPLRIFPLKGASQMRRVERPPLVGRKQDLLQLSLLQARALEEQRPQFVSIVAPAGTGKTRLLEEFLKRLDPDDGFQVASVRCLPYGQTLTYWPLRGLLSDLLGSEELTKTRVQAIFTAGGYKQEDAQRLADLILATLGIEGEGTKDRESIFAAWRLLIETLSLQAPRILIFEDLHWASDSLLDLVEHIIHLRTQASLLLIALSRPELLDRRPTWGGGRQNFTSLALQPLTVAQTGELVKRLMRDLPQETCQLIVERSGGNPFFALELVHSIAERDLSSNLAILVRLPDTVHAAVLARIDQLSKVERSVLQVASVAGRAFTITLLGEVISQHSLRKIELALDALQARDMIVPAEGGTFAFRHILIHDVAYDTLSRTERIRLHERVATTLETSAREHLDEYVELIAYHYLEAVSLARKSAVRSNQPIDATKAIHFLRRASILSNRGGAYAEAQNLLRSTINIAPESEQMTLYEELGDSVYWSKVGFDAYVKALEYWQKLIPSEEKKRAYVQAGARLRRKLLISLSRGGLREMIDVAIETLLQWRLEAQQLAEEAEDEDELWRLRSTDLFIYDGSNALNIVDGQWVKVEDPAELEAKRQIGLAAAAYFEQKGAWLDCSEALDGCSFIATIAGNYQVALEDAQRRLPLPDLPTIERGDVIHVIISNYMRHGDYNKGFQIIEEAIQNLRPGQSLLHLTTALVHAFSRAYQLGRWSLVERWKPLLDEIYEQTVYDPSVQVRTFDGYLYMLDKALAQEDRPAIDANTSLLRRLASHMPSLTESLNWCIDLVLSDDRQSITIDASRLLPGMAAFNLVYFNEQGAVCSKDIIAKARMNLLNTKTFACYLGIAQSLVTEDYHKIAQYIDGLEALEYIVHAARMRVMLAARTGDHSQLERARPILEQLGDRRAQLRLEDVEAMIRARETNLA